MITRSDIDRVFNESGQLRTWAKAKVDAAAMRDIKPKKVTASEAKWSRATNDCIFHDGECGFHWGRGKCKRKQNDNCPHI